MEDPIHQQQYSAVDNAGTNNPLNNRPVIQKADERTAPVNTPTLAPLDATQNEAKRRQMTHKQFVAVQTGDVATQKLLGVQGLSLKEGSEKLSTAGKVTVAVGIVGTAAGSFVGLPEPGEAVIAWGGTMNRIGSFGELASDFKDKNYTNAAIDATSMVAGEAASKAIGTALPEKSLWNKVVNYILDLGNDKSKEDLKKQEAPNNSPPATK